MKQKVIGIFILCLSLTISFVYAQTEIRGKVSAQDGRPLPGTTISVKGSSTIISSGPEGNYSIKASNGSTLVFKSLGYIAKEVAVTK